MSPQNGWVKFWRSALDSDDLMGTKPSTRWAFLVCIALARSSKGKYRGFLVNARHRAMTLKKLAELAGMNRTTFRNAISDLTDEKRTMLKWESVRGKRCLVVANYDFWQSPVVDKNDHTLVNSEYPQVSDAAQGKNDLLGKNDHFPQKRGQNRPPVGGEDCKDEEGTPSTPPPPPVVVARLDSISQIIEAGFVDRDWPLPNDKQLKQMGLDAFRAGLTSKEMHETVARTVRAMADDLTLKATDVFSRKVRYAKAARLGKAASAKAAEKGKKHFGIRKSV